MIKQKIMVYAAWLFFSLCIPVFGNEQFNPIFAAQGMLTYKEVRGHSATSLGQDWFFTVMSDNAGRWKLQLHTKLPDPRFPVESIQHLAYDGTNIYSVVYSPQVVVTRPGSPPKLVPATEKTGAAKVSSGPYPADYGGAVGIIWLAFFGGAGLDPSKDQEVFPNVTVGNPRFNPAAWSCDLRYKLAAQSNVKLIEKGDFWLNLNYLTEDFSKYPELDEPGNEATYDRLAGIVAKCRKLKGNGLLLTRFKVDQAQIVNGISLPARFHAEILPIDIADPTFYAEGVVTNFLPFKNQHLLPTLDGLINVQDHRFRQKTQTGWTEGVHYMITDGKWIVDTNSDIISLALSQTPLNLRMETSKTIVKNSGVRRILFGMCLLSLLIVLLRRWQQRRIKS